MTTAVETPNSSVKSSSTINDDDDYSLCFSRCRRDANCNCKICLASIKATLDLLPMSAQRSSKPSPPQNPNFLNTSSTPKSNSSRSTSGSGVTMMMMMKCVLVLCVILIAKLGFSYVNFRAVKMKLSPEIVRSISERSLGFRDVKEQLWFLKNEIQNLVGDNVSEARSANSNWEILQDGLMLRSRYQLYKSGIEEVSIWGWPLQTSGLLTSKFASRSFTILSGRVTEWLNGGLSSLIREANSSWEQEKWSASVLRLDENTWILEYKRSFVFENTRPFSSAMEFLKFEMMRSFQWMKRLSKFCNDNH